MPINPTWLQTDPLGVLTGAAAAGDRRAQLMLQAQSQAISQIQDQRNTALQQQRLAQDERQFVLGLQEGAKRAAEQLASNIALAKLREQGELARVELNREVFQKKEADEAKKEALRLQGITGLERDIANRLPLDQAVVRNIRLFGGDPNATASALSMVGRTQASEEMNQRMRDIAEAANQTKRETTEAQNQTKLQVAELNAKQRELQAQIKYQQMPIQVRMAYDKKMKVIQEDWKKKPEQKQAELDAILQEILDWQPQSFLVPEGGVGTGTVKTGGGQQAVPSINKRYINGKWVDVK